MNNPKSILITGATSGIGAKLAEAYAASGITLFLSGRNSERLAYIAQICEKLGATVFVEIVDVKDSEHVRRWVLECDKKTSLDLVIANAGISNAGEEREEKYDREIFAINVMGVLNTIFPIIPLMQQRKHGQIAIMSSLASMHGFPRAPAYCASKAAVKTFGEALRNKLKRDRVEVSVVCPGFIKTPLTDQNDFAMPFMMSVDKAAKIIIKDLAKNRGLIVFPLRMYFLLWFLRILPYRLIEKVASYI